MDVSRMAAIVGDNFGDKTALKGFCEGDGGLWAYKGTSSIYGETRASYAVKLILRAAMNSKSGSHFVSDRATFIVSEGETTGLSDEREEELRAITERFEQFDRDTVRTDIRRLFTRLYEVRAGERTMDLALEVQHELALLFELDDRRLGG